MDNTHSSGSKSKIAIAIGVIIVLAAIISGWYILKESSHNPMSEDAVIGSNVVRVSSEVPGRIESIHVMENSRVKKGDLLFTIDPYVYRLQVEQARADLKIAEAAMDTQHRTVIAEQSNSGITNDQITAARTNLQLATQTLARLKPLEAKGYVTKQQVDDATTIKRNAEVMLQQALKQSVAAEALVSNTDSTQALVSARRAALAIAERMLAHTEVRAPHDGLVVGLRTSSGEFVIPDQVIFTLIDTQQWHAAAYYRETDLGNIKIGNCATVYVLADRSRTMKGRVQGIGWGVMSDEQLNIPRSLPYVPKSLNWVRVEQRFPVRILLDNPPPDLMRVGATAVTIVRNDNDC
ncbi:multidrug transporter subunit MdtN [Klebsiella sp. BIGb0407]|uniref:multidrug transporter subunit MdtN n=1 Tax=Klebsiella sp. BIGb0407 TaxID=2940603 RepID=UPI00216AB0BD|nr:multidrug transporter subunit MdtN [Klebsiella sp. BIGb0407]MCS3430972.1 multidrug efflux system membrane fusion protein [Klebsiella sp. BIGb0407]